ncbi:DUF3099 domain-containing protein [Streptomyces sp. NPDC048301]|uniref:DUF3099 domain-containing protein n=1 Tax=unclassified Streptomyces TaxID=2593676 RepID=UPI0034401EFC
MYARRRRVYFMMMGGCLLLFVSAWAFVRLWSVPAAVAMCVVAMVIPPVAAIVANRRGPEDRWWDDHGHQAQQAPPKSRPDRPAGTDGPSGASAPERGSRPRTAREQPTGDPQSDAWWDELDGRNRRR